MPEVKCSVANCNYWSDGNNCVANEIMIDVDKHANTSFNAEFADESFAVDHQDKAVKVKDTCCHTFEQKKRNA
ncbi:MAG: DUF1540 domain-containing protein [Paenibacillaceae bacterium]